MLKHADQKLCTNVACKKLCQLNGQSAVSLTDSSKLNSLVKERKTCYL